MKNLKIGAKLMLGFGIVIVLLLTIAISSVTYLSRSSNDIDYLSVHTLPDTNTVWNVRRDFLSAQRNLYKAISSNENNEIKTLLDASDADVANLFKNLEVLEADYQGDPNDIPLAREALEKAGVLRRAAMEYIVKNNAADNNKAFEILSGDYTVAASAAEDYLMNIANGIGSRSTTKIDSANSNSSFAVVLVIFVSVGALIIALAVATYISRGISRPMSEIEKATKEMAGGSLHVSIDYESKDELGSLASSMKTLCSGINNIIIDIGKVLSSLADGDFHATSECTENYIGDYEPILSSMNLIRDNLNSTLLGIDQASEQVSAGADQVSGGSQELSQGATEQASSVEELAATINEVSAKIKQTAEYALSAKTDTDTAGREMQKCSEQMNYLSQAMGRINDTSSQIGNIIKTIDDIAFQTNILALNAAVEAARAGTAGKGFAVVADEVRSLASKSAEAAKNTTGLIESALSAIKDGTQITVEANNSVNQIAESAQKVSINVDKIAVAANEQASAIIQITQGVDQISSVVQTNSATAEESAAASEELSGQAQMLKTLVGRFNLLDTTNK